MCTLLNLTYYVSLWFFFSLFFWSFLGPHLWHMEVSRLGVKLELQLLAYATAMPKQDLSLQHSSQQCWILNPLREAWDWTCVLMDTSWICFHWAMMGTPMCGFLKNVSLEAWTYVTFFFHKNISFLNVALMDYHYFM